LAVETTGNIWNNETIGTFGKKFGTIGTFGTLEQLKHLECLEHEARWNN